MRSKATKKQDIRFLTKWRKDILGFTQKEAADFLGVATNTYSRWERGELRVPLIARRFIVYFYSMEVFKS